MHESGLWSYALSILLRIEFTADAVLQLGCAGKRWRGFGIGSVDLAKTGTTLSRVFSRGCKVGVGTTERSGTRREKVAAVGEDLGGKGNVLGNNLPGSKSRSGSEGKAYAVIGSGKKKFSRILCAPKLVMPSRDLFSCSLFWYAISSSSLREL